LTEEIMFNQREKIVDVWYLGTNQNGIIFELLTAYTPNVYLQGVGIFYYRSRVSHS
jgi:hypothetical protein